MGKMQRDSLLLLSINARSGLSITRLCCGGFGEENIKARLTAETGYAGFCGARGGRTLTVSPPTDFKSVASADSAIAPACIFSLKLNCFLVGPEGSLQELHGNDPLCIQNSDLRRAG